MDQTEVEERPDDLVLLEVLLDHETARFTLANDRLDIPAKHRCLLIVNVERLVLFVPLARRVSHGLGIDALAVAPERVEERTREDLMKSRATPLPARTSSCVATTGRS